MSLLRTHGWRLPLLAGGVLMALGGRMHPDADAEDSLVQELATMTADDRWVPGHLLIVAGTMLMVGGLWAARSAGTWPRARQAVTWAAVAFSAYAVETVFHAAAAADHDQLQHGELGPIALTHVVLSSFSLPDLRSCPRLPRADTHPHRDRSPPCGAGARGGRRHGARALGADHAAVPRRRGDPDVRRRRDRPGALGDPHRAGRCEPAPLGGP